VSKKRGREEEERRERDNQERAGDVGYKKKAITKSGRETIPKKKNHPTIRPSDRPNQPNQSKKEARKRGRKRILVFHTIRERGVGGGVFLDELEGGAGSAGGGSGGKVNGQASSALLALLLLLLLLLLLSLLLRLLRLLLRRLLLRWLGKHRVMRRLRRRPVRPQRVAVRPPVAAAPTAADQPARKHVDVQSRRPSVMRHAATTTTTLAPPIHATNRQHFLFLLLHSTKQFTHDHVITGRSKARRLVL